MGREYKYSFKIYSAWNYEKEVEDLNRASEEGWQLVRGYGLHSKFVKNEHVRYRYQLDYGKIDDIGRYIETFREQGWEYVNSTFNGWHYFRKFYDPALPEEEYEIFSDRESLHEMNNRWARFAFIIGIIIGILAVFYAIRIFKELNLPNLILFLTLAVEAAVLIRGGLIMRNPEASRNRRGDSAFLYVFIAVIILGVTASSILAVQRPHFYTEQRADAIDEPIVDSRWTDFEIRYPDNYYLDLDMRSDEPMTFEIQKETGETVYSKTENQFADEEIRVKLSKGKYRFSMSCESGYYLKASIR